MGQRSTHWLEHERHVTTAGLGMAGENRPPDNQTVHRDHISWQPAPLRKMGNLLAREEEEAARPLHPWAKLARPQQYMRYDPSGAKIHSLTCVSSLHIKFVNCTPFVIDTYWLNYKGKQVRYQRLLPGEAAWQQTYHTHPWVFKAVGRPDITPFVVVGVTKQQVLFPARDRDVYRIELAPIKSWLTSVHATHYKGCSLFVAQVKALLLAHHRLSQETLTGQKCDSSGLQEAMGLQDLPRDVLPLIIKHMAPPVPDVRPVTEADMCLPTGEALMRLHLQAQQQLQQMGKYD